MTISQGSFTNLVSLIYASVIDENKWFDFLAELTRISGGVRTHLFGHDLSANITLGLTTAGYAPDFIESYSNYYGAINAWAPGLARLQPGRASSTQVMFSRDALLQTEFYADWVRPQEDIIAGGGALIFNDHGRMVALGGSIRRKDEEKLEASWLQTVDMLVPHIRHAFEISRALAGRTVEIDALQSAKSLGHEAVMLLSEDGMLLYANPLGESMIQSRLILHDDILGRVSFTDTQAAHALDGCLRRMRQKARPVALHFKLRDDIRNVDCAVNIVEFLPELHPIPPFALATSFWRASLLVTISIGREVARADELFARENGLTAAELSVAVDLVNGLTPGQIADKRSASIHTVRNQLRAAMSKAGLRRQVDLVRLIERFRSQSS